MRPPATAQGGPPLAKKKKSEKVAHIEKRMDEAYHFLKQVATKPKPPKDVSQLFCDLLCSKLQAMDEDKREIAMHEIDNVMFRLRNPSQQTRNMQVSYFNPQTQQFVHHGNKHHYGYQYPIHGSGTPSTSTTPTPSPTASSSRCDFEEGSYNADDDCPNTIADLFTNFQK